MWNLSQDSQPPQQHKILILSASLPEISDERQERSAKSNANTRSASARRHMLRWCQCNIPWAEVPFSSGPGPKFSCTGKEMRDQASWRERRSYLCTGNKKVAPLSPFSLTQLSPFLAMSVPTLLFASAATSTFRFDNVRRRTIVRRSNSAIVDANVAINATITRQRYCTAQLQKLAPFFLMNSYHAAKVTVARRPLRGGSRDVYNPQRGL